jgi:predicted N-acetyltransferase YhbS
MKIKIRNEEPKDFKRVEEITRKAFYNLYMPGCTEHYLVHIMRNHKDFIKELAFVLELNEEIIGNIMYTKATLRDESGTEKEIVSFGPVCLLPEQQRKGYGKLLLEHSFEKATELGYDVVVVTGSPSNYVGRGFKSCKRFNISLENGTFLTGMMARELNSGALDDRKWTYYESSVMHIDEQEAAHFDDTLEKMEKKYQSSQEEFYILSNSILG